jgi:ABC-type amino acid transport substrate-binding protein
MAVRKEDTALRDDLNRAIKALRANGTYQKINAKYFDYDIFGG